MICRIFLQNPQQAHPHESLINDVAACTIITGLVCTCLSGIAYSIKDQPDNLKMVEFSMICLGGALSAIGIAALRAINPSLFNPDCLPV
jgi:hypothetical protein